MGRWYTALIIGFVAGVVAASVVFALASHSVPWGGLAIPVSPSHPERITPLPFFVLAVLTAGYIIVWYVRRESVREARAEWEQERARQAMDHVHQLEQQRHDFFNQLTVISALLQMGATERCLAYVKRMLDPAAAREGDGSEISGQGKGVQADGPPGGPGERPPRGEL